MFFHAARSSQDSWNCVLFLRRINCCLFLNYTWMHIDTALNSLFSTTHAHNKLNSHCFLFFVVVFFLSFVMSSLYSSLQMFSVTGPAYHSRRISSSECWNCNKIHMESLCCSHLQVPESITRERCRAEKRIHDGQGVLPFGPCWRVKVEI